MAVDLSDYTDTLRREVSPPGSTLFATVSDDVFAGYLADAFWDVKLDGWQMGWVCDVNGIVVPVNDPQIAVDNKTVFTKTPFDPNADLPRDKVALICLYAGIKIIRNRLFETTQHFRAKAGPVEYEQDYSSNVLTTMLKELQDIRQRLLVLNTYSLDVALIDGFSARSTSAASYSGYLYDWYVGAFGMPWTDMFGEFGVL